MASATNSVAVVTTDNAVYHDKSLLLPCILAAPKFTAWSLLARGKAFVQFVYNAAGNLRVITGTVGTVIQVYLPTPHILVTTYALYYYWKIPQPGVVCHRLLLDIIGSIVKVCPAEIHSDSRIVCSFGVFLNSALSATVIVGSICVRRSNLLLGGPYKQSRFVKMWHLMITKAQTLIIKYVIYIAP